MSVCVCAWVGCLDQVLGFVGYLYMSFCVPFQLCMCGGMGVCGWVYIRYWALLANQSVFCFSCVCVCIGLDEILGFVGYL